VTQLRVLGVIPARGGSKRVPRKNEKLLCGKPLLTYTIDHAKEAKALTNFVVSTEDKKIETLAHSKGALVLNRPKELAEDDVTTGAVALHALEAHADEKYDAVCVLHPTSPVRAQGTIDECVQLLADNEEYACVATTKPMSKLHPYVFPYGSNQAFDGTIDIITPSVYVVRAKALKENKSHVCFPICLMRVPDECCVDIDTEYDFAVARATLRYLAKNS
jgi:CMP-N-acetylneuraminic acid synthetase